ncbi:NHLP leader peptide family RiPP precursor [Paenibacillus sp. GCM10023252]|uniref:NHLP leader peptide family RiPP precursor n=1 Tax=Paenibacillus sp. GCM10023252 TaxID=3252649 RepID=UPI0036196A34
MSAQASLRERIIEKAWEDEKFKTQLLQNPKLAINEAFGIDIPEEVSIQVLEEKKNSYYLIIPPNPAELSSTPDVEGPMW